MGVLDDCGTAVIFVALSARERELSRNDYLLRCHPEDVEKRELEYKSRYGDLDDVNVISKRFGVDKADFIKHVKNLLEAGLIAPDKATADAYKPIADLQGVKIEDALWGPKGGGKAKAAPKALPPRTFEISPAALLNELLEVARSYSPENITVKKDPRSGLTVSAEYAWPRKASPGPRDAVIRDIQSNPAKLNGLVSFWANFYTVSLLKRYLEGGGRIYTIHEMLLHLYVELKELVTDLTLQDGGRSVPPSVLDFGCVDLRSSPQAEAKVKTFLSDQAVASLLRLADASVSAEDAKRLRESVLVSGLRPLSDALLWHADFHLRHESRTVISLEAPLHDAGAHESTSGEIPPNARKAAKEYLDAMRRASTPMMNVWEELEAGRKK
jgi:hypothetical protein